MHPNWLYGIEQEDPVSGALVVRTRSKVFDLGTVEDLLATGRKLDANTVLLLLSDYDKPYTGELRDLADWQLRQMDINARTLGVHIFLRDGYSPVVQSHAAASLNDLSDAAELARAWVTILKNDGRPRVRWQPWVIRWPRLVSLLLVASWVWVTVSSTPSTPWLVFGSLATLIGAFAAWLWSPPGLLKYREMYPGHLVQAVSRDENRARRASHRSNLKLAAWTLPLGAVLGGLVTLLFSHLA